MFHIFIFSHVHIQPAKQENRFLYRWLASEAITGLVLRNCGPASVGEWKRMFGFRIFVVERNDKNASV